MKPISSKLVSLMVLTLGLAAAGCSTDLYQRMKVGTTNMLSTKASTAAGSTVTTEMSGSPQAGPAAAPAAAPVVNANATAAMPAGMPAGYAAMGALPYKISTLPADQAAGKSDACKNAKTGACAAFAGGSANGIGQAFCLTSCTAKICGQADMANYYAQQASAAGMDCSSQ